MTDAVELKSLLKSADAPIKNFVAALESENLKLQRQIAKYQAENLSLKHKIAGLNEQLKKKVALTPFQETIRRAMGTSIPIAKNK
jgi:cell division protein FtsB